MITHSIGDQSRALATRSSLSRIKSALDISLSEVSNKRVADVGQKFHGNLRVLNSIEARSATIDRYQKNAAEIANLLDRKQLSLEQSQKITRKLIEPLLNEAIINGPGVIEAHAIEAKQAFYAVVGNINTEVAGQSLFSGLATDKLPLIPADEILTELARLTDKQTTAADITKTISDWFDAESGEGGYLDFAYKGTLKDDETRLINISESRRTDLAGTAADPEIRNMLKGLAITAVLEQGASSMAKEEQHRMLRRSGEILFQNNEFVVVEIGKIGLKQQLVEQSNAENSAALAVLEKARIASVGADPYQSALALNENATHLEVMFSVTARLSELTLTRFLR